MNIVAFAGRKQSGKTTCAEFLLKYYNGAIENFNSARLYNFADPLKNDICMNILGLTYEQCYGEDIYKNTLTDIKWEGNNLTAREVMQFVGTDIFRKMKNDVWAGATIKKILSDKPQLAVIADCRFPNEVEAVRSVGGIVIKLTRNPFNSNHDSEIALDEINYAPSNFDLIIYNENINIPQQNQIVLDFLKKKKVLS